MTGRVLFSFALLALASLLPAQTPQPDASVPCTDPRAGQFDFWIGDWDIDNFHRDPSSTDDPTWYATGQAHNRVLPIVDGCAILEHWHGTLSWGDVHGVSIRQFDPTSENWKVVGAWPTSFSPNPVFGSFQGRFRGQRVELFTQWTAAEGRTVENRLTFSDITSQEVRWESETSDNSGLTWKGNWIMEMSRHDPLDGPVQVGPTIEGRSGPFCTDPSFRELDHLIGSWRFVSAEDDDSPAATLEVFPILGGCALMDEIVIDEPEGAKKRFHIRLRDPATGKWTQQIVDNRLGTLRSSSGLVSDNEMILAAEAERETWSWSEDDASRERVLVWSLETRNEEEWVTEKSIRFVRVD